MKKRCHHNCSVAVAGKDDETQKYNICFHQFTEILETIAKEKGTLLRTQSLVHLLLTHSLTRSLRNSRAEKLDQRECLQHLRLQ